MVSQRKKPHLESLITRNIPPQDPLIFLVYVYCLLFLKVRS